jgi:hypothetical protein
VLNSLRRMCVEFLILLTRNSRTNHGVHCTFTYIHDLLSVVVFSMPLSIPPCAKVRFHPRDQRGPLLISSLAVPQILPPGLHSSINHRDFDIAHACLMCSRETINFQINCPDSFWRQIHNGELKVSSVAYRMDSDSASATLPPSISRTMTSTTPRLAPSIPLLRSRDIL